MELKQSDRDALRASQQKINPKTVIGNIVEHRPQDPRCYKKLSRLDEQMTNDSDNPAGSNPLEINYQSKYLDIPSPEQSQVIKMDEELPISIQDVQANSWLNMDQVELNKLEWMSSKAQQLEREQNCASTKFDKQGRVVVKSISDKVDGLNGDEASHDIETLVNLLDSAYQPQITYALLVISRIANLATTGFYDGAFDENIHEILIKNCLLRVRHHMDSPNETICLHALVCMKSLICNTVIDEINLDKLYPIISNRPNSGTWLRTNEMIEQQFTIGMKDIECVQIDAIMALIERTEILSRFIYLLNTKLTTKFSLNYYDQILNILIRFARHSPKVCDVLNQQVSLFDLILKLFLPKTITTENKHIRPLSVKALKLIRIVGEGLIALNFRTVAGESHVICKLPTAIVDSLQVYFFVDWVDELALYDHDSNREVIRQREDIRTLNNLTVESYRLTKTLSQLKKFSGPVKNLIGLGQAKLFTALKSVYNLESTTPLCQGSYSNWIHAAHLVDLVGIFYRKFCEYPTGELSFLETYWFKYVREVLLQWLTDVVMKKYIPNLEVSIAIAAIFEHMHNNPFDHSKIDSTRLSEIFFETDENTLNANRRLFRLLIQNLDTSSHLPDFSKISGQLRDPKCLPSYGILNYNTTVKHQFKLNSMMDKNSPHLLLNLFVLKLRDANDINLIGSFLDDATFTRYIRRTTSYHDNEFRYESIVRRSLLAQYEVDIVANSLLALARYYHDYSIIDSSTVKTIEKVQETLNEPSKLAKIRCESYSNICYQVIALLGLLNTNQNSDSYKIQLKDALFERVLLNKVLQHRLASENYRKTNVETSPSRLWKTFEFTDVFKGQNIYHTIGEKHMQILIPLYTSLNQTSRFWIIEPILKYYLGQVVGGIEQLSLDEEKGSERGSSRNGASEINNKCDWFRRNIPYKVFTGALSDANDPIILATILDFNLSMMLYSNLYTQNVVRPNLEDYLCILGTLFLHDDIFIDEEVNNPLSRNIRLLLSEALEEEDALFRDASRLIKPLNMTLADYFNKLVEQFEAASYGDPAFSNFLLLFITANADKHFRKKLFQENVETCLQQLGLDGDSLWVPEQLFFSSRESDIEIKMLIKKSGPFLRNKSFLQKYRYYHIQ